MPIHNLGYRPWNGTLEGPSSRWTVVAEIGIRRAWQSSWLRRMTLFAWLPVLVLGLMIFMFEQAQQKGGDDAINGMQRVVATVFAPSLSPHGLMTSAAVDAFLKAQAPEEKRHTFWSLLLLSLFRKSQGLWLIAIIGVIAPPLISQDFRSRAFLLYFSRPLSRIQYILGKAATLITYLLMITFLPALLLYVVGVLLSPDLSIVRYTWDLPIRITAVCTLIIIPSASLAMMLSAMTNESRYASFAWFAIWIFGFLAYLSVVPYAPPSSTTVVQCLSLYHLFSDVTGWALDKHLAIEQIETRLIVLGLITTISLAVVYRRVSAPMQI